MKKIFSFLLLGLVLSIGNAWADNYNETYNYSDLGDMLSGNYTDATTYWKVPGTASNTATIAIPINHQPTSDITITFNIATFGSGTNPSSSNTTITAVGTEAGSNWSGSAVSTYPSSSSFVNGVMTITKPASPTTLGGLTITMGVNAGVKIFRLKSITVQYTYAAAAVATPTFSPAAGTYTSAQNVTLSCATPGSEIYYTLDGTTPTGSSDKYTSAINVNETMTIKAIAKNGDDYSNVASATYTIYPILHAGTEADPYTVADARNAIDANTGLTDIYVSGIVCEGGSELSNGAMNYWISDDGTETNKFEIYKGKGISGASFANTSDVKEGDAVVVTGTIKKFGSVYEFESGSQLVSLVPPVNPLISVTPSSLTGFTYGLGSGPSVAQTFSVTGSNLTADISLSLGESNYEMSLTAGSGYTNSLTLTQIAGEVAATTIYVRLKAGLAVNASYNDIVVLTSTGATDKGVSLSGSVTQPTFTWDLSIDETLVATATAMSWASDFATMDVAKGSATTATNNYYPGTPNQQYSSTRLYKNSILTIKPTCGYSIVSVVFTATTESYANALKGSSWTNATAAASTTTVTITPTDCSTAISATIGATCGFTAVKVYYEGPADSIIVLGTNGWSTFAANYKFETTATVYKAVVNNDKTAVVLTEVENAVVPAGVGVILKGAQEEDVLISPSAASASDFSGNQLVGVTSAINAPANGYVLATIDQDGITKFHPCNATVTIPANKAYIAIGEATAPSALRIEFAENNATDIQNVEGAEKAVKFIENGKLYIQKNGVVYDAMGKTVR